MLVYHFFRVHDYLACHTYLESAPEAYTKMKKSIFTFLFLSFIATTFAQSPKITENEKHEWIFDTSFPELMRKGIDEEIKIQNNSSVNLNHVTCTVVINGKEHKMQTIQKIKSGEKEEFDGYEDDEMQDEFPHYFGEAGRFTRRNTNDIRFIINFKEHRNDVIISDVYMNDSHLLFIIEDSPNRHIKTEEESLEETGAQVIIVDGKKFLLYGGKAYPVE